LFQKQARINLSSVIFARTPQESNQDKPRQVEEGQPAIQEPPPDSPGFCGVIFVQELKRMDGKLYDGNTPSASLPENDIDETTKNMAITTTVNKRM